MFIKKISERVQKYYIRPDYSHVELIFRVLNWSWKDHSDLTVYGWRYKGTHLHLFLKAFIEPCYVWKFSFHTYIQLHMFISSITRTCKPKRRYWKGILFTVNAVDSLLVQISAAVVFCFLFRLKVLETRRENVSYIIFREGIFLCCRKGLINIEI